MSDETSSEAHESTGVAGGHAPAIDLSGLSPEQLAEAARELFADAPQLQPHLDELVKISQEKDEQKREELLSALKQKDAAAFEGEVPELLDVHDDGLEVMAPASASAGEEGPPSPGGRASELDITVQACLVAAEGLGVLMGLFGLRVPAKKLSEALQKKTKPSQWRYVMIAASKEIAAAKRLGDRMQLARAYWKIIAGLLRVASVKVVVQVTFGTMNAEDWIKFGAIVLAQLTVWFGTQGLAFTAQVALTALDAVSLIEDSIKLSNMVSASGGDAAPPDPVAPVAPVDPGSDGPPILIDGSAPTRFRGKHVIAGRSGTVYLIRQGKLYRYRHQDFENGSNSWAAPVELGSGWGGSDRAVLASNEGVLYRVTSDGRLLWYQDEGHAGGGGGLANNGRATAMGTGWNQFLRVMAADDGVLYAVTSAGDLQWFRHDPHARIAETGRPNWRVGGGSLKVGDGWHDFKWSGASSAGVLYALSPDGTLRQFTHWGQAEGTKDWSQPAIVGKGWTMFTVVTVSNDGVFYGVHASGVLSWYRHDGMVDATERWRSVLEAGTGWLE